MTATGSWGFYQEEPLQHHSLLSEPKELWILISSDTQNPYQSYGTNFIQITGTDCAAEYDGGPITSLEKLSQWLIQLILKILLLLCKQCLL